MVSDIVLLKELPDFIKDSIEAYVGCLSGAILKDEYLEAIREAGFHEVKILDQASLPIESMVDDPTTKALIDDLKIPPEKVTEIGSSVLSIKVYGVKPNETA